MLTPAFTLREQPKFPAKIARAMPLARGLVFAAYPIGNAYYDAVTGAVSTAGATWASRHTIDGNLAPATELRTTELAFPQYSTGLDKLAGPFSIFAEGCVFTNSTEAHVARSFANSTGNGIGFKFDDANLCTNGFYCFGDNGNRSASNFDSLGLNSEQYRHRAMITGDGTNLSFYAKGALDRTVADAFTPTAGLDRFTSMLYGNAGALSLFLAFDRPLTLAEYQAIYFNPWQLFQAPERSIFPVSVAASGALSGTASATSSASGTLAGAGSLSGTSSATSTASGTLAGSGALTGTASATSTASGTLSALGALTGTSSAASSASGTLSGAGALSGTGSSTATATGTLAGSGALAGTASATGTASGTLSDATAPAGALSGTASATTSASGTLNGAGALSGSASASSTASGTIQGAGALSGTASATSSGSATLSGFSALSGSASATTSASGTLAGSGSLSGSASALCSGIGILIGMGALAGSASATSSASGLIQNFGDDDTPENVTLSTPIYIGIGLSTRMDTGVSLSTPI